ncbi:MAG TPA: WecB/TagA/CpsF family glycosyltransferase, partial [Planctomycetota bacterium]|nr:WecB/TagA/CpsF family glycosyltransferase [Planctomycetota bacterium]
MSTPTPKADLFGIPVDALTMAQVVERCRQSMLARERMLIGAVNAAKIVKMRENELLRSSVLEADLVIADGMAVVWASRILRRRLPERVTGIDLFERLLDVGHQEGLAAYFLGATPEVLEELLRRVRERWSGLRIAGAHDGYFKDEEAEAIAEEI